MFCLPMLYNVAVAKNQSGSRTHYRHTCQKQIFLSGTLPSLLLAGSLHRTGQAYLHIIQVTNTNTQKWTIIATFTANKLSSGLKTMCVQSEDFCTVILIVLS